MFILGHLQCHNDTTCKLEEQHLIFCLRSLQPDDLSVDINFKICPPPSLIPCPTLPLVVCGKEFNRMYNLLGHMHLHSDSKPFKCPYCSSKFTLKGNLSRHMKVKHGVMDIVLDGQESLLDIGHSERIENQQADIEDYEENSFDFTSGQKAADDTSDSTKMSDDESMKDIYFNFEKEAESSYSWFPLETD
eukprot:g38539.t1